MTSTVDVRWRAEAGVRRWWIDHTVDLCCLLVSSVSPREAAAARRQRGIRVKIRVERIQRGRKGRGRRALRHDVRRPTQQWNHAARQPGGEGAEQSRGRATSWVRCALLGQQESAVSTSLPRCSLEPSRRAGRASRSEHTPLTIHSVCSGHDAADCVRSLTPSDLSASCCARPLCLLSPSASPTLSPRHVQACWQAPVLRRHGARRIRYDSMFDTHSAELIPPSTLCSLLSVC